MSDILGSINAQDAILESRIDNKYYGREQKDGIERRAADAKDYAERRKALEKTREELRKLSGGDRQDYIERFRVFTEKIEQNGLSPKYDKDNPYDYFFDPAHDKIQQELISYGQEMERNRQPILERNGYTWAKSHNELRDITSYSLVDKDNEPGILVQENLARKLAKKQGLSISEQENLGDKWIVQYQEQDGQVVTKGAQNREAGFDIGEKRAYAQHLQERFNRQWKTIEKAKENARSIECERDE